jgi:hypothetical protein
VAEEPTPEDMRQWDMKEHKKVVIPMKQYAKTVAVRMYTHLHSAAGENFVSSLLTASLNECPELLHWLMCDKAKLKLNPRLDYRRFYASANDQIPKFLRGVKNPYTLADIIVWDRKEVNKWNVLTGKGEKRSAAKQMHTVFVEVKYTSLDKKDTDKYKSFAKRTSGKGKNLKFVVISAHDKSAIARIKRGRGLSTPEKLWETLLFNTYGVKHVTYEELYEELCNHEESPQPVNQQYLILPILQEYLRLHFHPEDADLWDEYVKYYELIEPSEARQREIKKELVEDIRDIAAASDIRVPHPSIKRFNSIIFYGKKEKAQFGNDAPPGQFLVKINDRRVTFGDLRKPKAPTISDCLAKLRNEFEQIS